MLLGAPFLGLILRLAAAQSAPTTGDVPAAAPVQAPVPAKVEVTTRSDGDGHAAEAKVELLMRSRLGFDEKQAVETQRRLARVAKDLSRNVVHITVERLAAQSGLGGGGGGEGGIGGSAATLEVSGFLLGPAGRVLTAGNALVRADRVAVHFVNRPDARPRRARVVGIDRERDVGLLDVGPIDVAEVNLGPPSAPTGDVGRGAARPGFPDGVGATRSAMVVSLWSVRGSSDNPVSLGVLDGEQPQAAAGLYRVSIVRRPEASGGIVLRDDGTVVAMLLGSAGFAGAPDSPLQPMLALPGPVLRAGVEGVLAEAKAREAAPADGSAPARAWAGFSASELAEPEFLHQIALPGAIVVDEIFEASPALAAGLEPHDLLLRWNDQPLHDVDDLARLLAASPAGTHVRLECLRHLERRNVELTLGAW